MNELSFCDVNQEKLSDLMDWGSPPTNEIYKDNTSICCESVFGMQIQQPLYITSNLPKT